MEATLLVFVLITLFVRWLVLSGHTVTQDGPGRVVGGDSPNHVPGLRSSSQIGVGAGDRASRGAT